MDENIQDNSEIDVLEELDELDKAIVRLRVEGFKFTEIAEKLEKHRGTIYKRLKKIKVQDAIRELQRKAIDILVDTQSEAANELRRIIRDSNAQDADKIRAAREILKGVQSDRVDLNFRYTDIKKLNDEEQKRIDEELDILSVDKEKIKEQLKNQNVDPDE